MHMCQDMYVEVRGQLESSFSPTIWVIGPPAWQQAPLDTEPPHWPNNGILLIQNDWVQKFGFGIFLVVKYLQIHSGIHVQRVGLRLNRRYISQAIG